MFRFQSSDAHLVTQILRGQKELYAKLVERYLPAVQAIARANAGSHADADDIAQDTFIDAFRRLDTLREASKFGHWLMRIARNKACDWAAAEIRERTKREAGGEAVQGGQGAVTPEQRELYDLLHRELEAMPPDQREVLALFHFAGHSTRQIAAMFGISHDAVRKRLQRGREALGERMLRHMEGVERDFEATRGRARKIYGAAVGIPVAWEAHGAAAGAGGGYALAVKSGWRVVAGKTGVVAAVIAVASGGYWLVPRAAMPASTGGVPGFIAPGARYGAATPPSGDTPETSGADVTSRGDGTEPLPSGDGIISGVVYGPDDQPLRQIAVHLTMRTIDPDGGLDFTRYPDQRSDERGAFRFEGLPTGSDWYRLQAETSDGALAAIDSEILADDFPVNHRFLEMAPALHVTGIVVDAFDVPVEGASIRPAWFQETGNPVTRSSSLEPPAISDGNGAFRFAHLNAGNWRFEVRAKGYATTLSGYMPAGSDAGRVVLEHGLAVRGTLTDASNGMPLPGRRVAARASSGEPGLSTMARTDESGHFQIEALNAGIWNIGTTDGWFSDPVEVLLEPDAPPQEIRLAARAGGVIRGRVLDEGGHGVPGLEVGITQQRAPRAVTGEDGIYSLAGLPEQDFTVYVGERTAENQVTVSLSSGELREGVDFNLVSGSHRVSGVVVDAGGAPMIGVEVEAFGQRANLVPRTARTGTDGRFQFERLAPDDFLWIRGKKAGLISRDLSRSLGNADLDGLVLVMEKPGSISGRLVNKQGRALGGFALSAQGRNITQYTTRGALSTERGRFSFPCIVPGVYTVNAGPENGVRQDVGEVTVAAGEAGSDVTLVYDGGPAFEIAGYIMDEDGKPVLTGVAANLQREGGGGDASVMADASGQFRFTALESGLYQIQFRKDGYSLAQLTEVLAGTTDLEVVMLRAARVEGKVRTGNGQALTDYAVQWFDGVKDRVSEYDRMDAQAVKDGDGQFVLMNVNAGTVTVAAWADGWAPAFATLELEGGETRSGVELRLEVAEAVPAPVTPRASTALHGLVTNARKEPVAGAHLYLDHRPHPTERTGEARAITGPDGRFVLEGVPLDTARLLAWHKDCAPAGVSLSLSEKAVHEVAVAMTPGGTLEGTLTGGGEALRDAHLSVDSVVLEQRFYDNIYPDAKGFYRAEHVVAGNTAINVHYKGRWYTFPANVAEGGTAKADIDLQTGTAAIDGTLLHDGEAVEGQIIVTIPLSNGGEERFTQQTTPNGRFYIDGLPEGTVRLEGRAENGEVVSQEVETIATQAIAVEINVQAAGEQGS